MAHEPNPTPHAGEYRFRFRDEEIRVIVYRDVIAVPSDGWSGEHYGPSISEEWLLTQPPHRIPGWGERRRALASAIRQALELHHGL